MKKGEVYTDRSPLSPEEIAKGKNFDALMAKLPTSGAGQEVITKTGKSSSASWIKPMLYTLGLAASITTAVLLLSKKTEVTAENAEQLTEIVQEIGIKPPFGDDVIPLQTAIINPNEDQVLHIGRSEIKIPANSILDAKGNAVQDPVKISFREFHTNSEIFMSGIPMHYDSSGTRMYFESAGMFEIKAEIADKPGSEELAIHQEKPIEVSWISKSNDTYFNQYFYNQDSNEWVFTAKDRAIPISNAAADSISKVQQVLLVSELQQAELEDFFLADEVQAKLQNEIKLLETQAPVKPIEAEEDAMLVAIEADSKYFPELKAYAGYKFEVLDLDRFDQRKADLEWNNINVKRGTKKGTYILHFWRPGEDYEVLCKPVLVGEDFEKAQEKYDELFASYQQGLEEKKAALRAKLEQDRAEAAKKKAAFMDQRKKQAEAIAAQRQADYTANITMRAFQVRNFGIWNCDAPQFMPVGTEITIVKLDEKGAPIVSNNLYLVEKGRNTLYNLSGRSSFEINPDADNVLIAITSAGSLAISDKVEVPEGAKKAECKTNFKVYSDKVQTMQDVQNILSSRIDM